MPHGCAIVGRRARAVFDELDLGGNLVDDLQRSPSPLPASAYESPVRHIHLRERSSIRSLLRFRIHLPFKVSSVPALEEIVGRDKAYGERDKRVRVIDTHARTTHGPTHDYVLTSAYIGFVIPLMIELQHLERQERA